MDAAGIRAGSATGGRGARNLTMAERIALVEQLPIPDVCVVGNHDLGDAGGPDAFARIPGPTRHFGVRPGQTRANDFRRFRR